MSSAMDESSVPVIINGHAAGLQPSSSSSLAPSMVPLPPPVQQVQRPRMKISHDEYMKTVSLVVLYLSEKERETGKGVDKDDLIDWYLESREHEANDPEELDYLKELITKVLRRMTKVGAVSC